MGLSSVFAAVTGMLIRPVAGWRGAGRRSSRREGNANLIGVAIAAGALAVAAVQAYQERQMDSDETYDYAMGDFLTSATDNAAAYLSSQYANIAGGILPAYVNFWSSVTPYSIPWATVTAAVPGAMPSPTPYGQTLSLVIRPQKNIDQIGQGNLCQNDHTNQLCPIEAFLVVSGGTAMNDMRLARVSRRVSQGRGGGIFAGIRMNAVTAPTVSNASGSDTWTVLNTEFAPLAWPGSGHPMARMVVGGGQTNTLALSRFSHPTANTMFASINMGGCSGASPCNDINAARTITGSEMVLSANANTKVSSGIYTALVVSSGVAVTKPTCPGGETASVFAFPANASDNGTGAPIIAIRVGVVDNGATWTPTLYVTTPDPTWTTYTTVTVNSSYGNMVVLAKCT